MTKLRKSQTILFGETEFFTETNLGNDVFGFARLSPEKDQHGFLVLVNFGYETSSLNLSHLNYLPKFGSILMRSSASACISENEEG